MDSHFISLPAQVADRLEQSIRQGAWQEWLPSERSLTEELQVSRKTLRKALLQLQQAGWIEACHGIGYRICQKPSGRISASTGTRERRIALLSPDPIEALRPYTALWIAELTALLARKDYRLEVVSGRKPFSRSPGKELQRLVRERPAACWILSSSTEVMQRWFQRQELPCIVSGSCHPEIQLPSVDLVYAAICRHALGELIRLGHRRMVMLAPRSDRVGDQESEAGFLEGAKSSSVEVSARIIRHSGEADFVCRLLDELMSEPTPPTALLINEPLLYLTVVSHLAARGLRVPADVSVICRDEDRFLSFVRPVPVRYGCRAQTFARKLLRPILTLAAGEPLAQPEIRIVADYVEGQSIGPARK